MPSIMRSRKGIKGTGQRGAKAKGQAGEGLGKIYLLNPRFPFLQETETSIA